MGAGSSPPRSSNYRLSTTNEYHSSALSTLGWELTVCNALYPPGTPIRKILARDGSYGHLLYDHLKRFIPLQKIEKVIEIGGGYGFLMKDLLGRNGRFRPCMLDISPTLLEKQRETLKGYDVSYRLEDALETDMSVLGQYELAILNENLGDFPAIVDLDCQIFAKTPSKAGDPVVEKVTLFFDKYSLERPVTGTFNLNIGAMEMVEKLCSSGIPYIFAGEHSCEAKAPSELGSLIDLNPTGKPKRIPLMGHDEYTVKLSYLQKMAAYHGYETIRGPFADYIVPNLTDGLKATLASRGRYSDNEEMICHFVGDLYEYEYLIMIKEGNREQGLGKQSI